MKIKLTIQKKLLLGVLSATALIFIGLLGYMGYYARNKQQESAHQFADAYAKEYANLIRSKLEIYMESAFNIADAIDQYKILNEENRRLYFAKLLKQNLNRHEECSAVWGLLEPESIDKLDRKMVNTAGSSAFGNFYHIYYRWNDQIQLTTQIVEDYDELFNSYYYDYARKTNKELLLDPYMYSYTGNESETIMVTSLMAPINGNNGFLGIIGVDITLEQFQTITQKISPYEGSKAFLVSNGGIIVGHPESSKLGYYFGDLYPDENNEFDIINNIYYGKEFSFNTLDTLTNKEQYVTFTPIKVRGSESPWSLGLIIPTSSITKEAERIINTAVILLVIGLIILSAIITMIVRNITLPVQRVTYLLKQLAKGKIDQDMLVEVHGNDEIADMNRALNTSFKGLLKKTSFARAIGEGNLKAKLDTIDESDVLGHSLLEMQQNLIIGKQAENESQEQERRLNWANTGLAIFAETLKGNHENISELAYKITNQLVKYLKANQGGLYLFNDNEYDPCFELITAYAYDRRKFNKKKVLPKEGMIGACAMEKESIYMTDIPDSYMEITSGLGDASPTSLLLVPLKVDEKVLGVIELASFNEFEAYQIDFAEKTANSIASTLYSSKINNQTRELLENSRLQAEQLAAQEEEMRQNMEELQATQEEAERKSRTLENLMQSFDKNNFVVYYNINGNIISINDKYANLLNLKPKQTLGMDPERSLLAEKKQNFWDKLLKGESINIKNQIQVNHTEVSVMENYIPLPDDYGTITQILKISSPINNRD